MPPSGYIDLNYLETSGSALVFRLENQSTQAIYFRGSTEGDGVVPVKGSSRMECRRIGSDAWEVEGKIAAAGQEIVEVPARKQLQLSVDGAFAQRHKPGSCRLRIALQGGTFIESRSFTP